jgi:arylsulfatase
MVAEWHQKEKNFLYFIMMKNGSILLLNCLLALLFISSCEHPPDKPNIVFILADDMGYSDLACYGAEVLETPNIDALAAGGLRFTHFYNTGRCWPTRTSLLSGFYPHQVLSDPMPGVDYSTGKVAPVTQRWLPSLLKDQGYRTYHSGKWHIVRHVPEYSQLSHSEVGFDHSYRTEDGRHLRPHHLWEDGQEIDLPGPGEEYEASVAIVDHALKYLEAHKQGHGEDPFFTYMAFIAPHFPLQAMQEDIDRYRGKFLMGWDEIRRLRAENRKELGFEVHALHPLEPGRFAPWNLGPEELVTQIDPDETGRAIPWDQLSREQQEFQATKMAIHAAMVTRMDREIGRFMDGLKELGYYENTIVFFCSDNGASTEIMNRADKHTIGATPGSADTYLCLGPGWSSAANTPFRLHKTWVHEGGIATPLVVHWPEGISGENAFRNMPSHITDIAPTLLELAGGSPEDLNATGEAPGISLVPFLQKDLVIPRPPIFFHHEQKKALRHGDWKITTIEKDGQWELYHLAEDRGETRNLAGEKPDKLQELVSRWENQRSEIIEQIGAADAR